MSERKRERERLMREVVAEREFLSAEFRDWFTQGKPLSTWEGVRKWRVRGKWFAITGRK